MWYRLWQWKAQRPGFVGVECNPNTAHRGDQHRIADSTRDRLAVDRDHLENVAMQMDWMRHRRVIDQLNLDALSRTEHERRCARPVFAAQRPGIGLHSASRRNRPDKISGAHWQRCDGGKPGLRRDCPPAELLARYLEFAEWGRPPWQERCRSGTPSLPAI
jgi:hypothetical protein